MGNMSRIFRHAIPLVVNCAFFFYLTASLCPAQEQEIIAGGEIEYQRHCATCHGTDGRGNGSLASQLRTQPADLTRISKNNGGQFPFWRVYRIIDGREEITGHGSREMPVWGARFQEETHGADRSAQSLVAGRILGLVFYLRHIQQE
ncbi:MAG TPA: c-type cytochrome [Candidatus Binatia bacterium]